MKKAGFSLALLFIIYSAAFAQVGTESYFSINEINKTGSLLSITQQNNINNLINSLNIVRRAWGKPMVVTSGFRSLDDQFRIYRNLFEQRKAPFNNVPAGAKFEDYKDRVPTGSAHLSGEAVDINDPSGSLYTWLNNNQHILELAGLYMEANTYGWVHLQTRPTSRRVFIPYEQ